MMEYKRTQSVHRSMKKLIKQKEMRIL